MPAFGVRYLAGVAWTPPIPHQFRTEPLHPRRVPPVSKEHPA